MVVAQLLQIVCYLLMAALLVRAVFSWVEPYPRNRVHRMAFDITEPLIGPVRRLVPPVAGFDLAFVIVFFGVSLLLQLAQRAA